MERANNPEKSCRGLTGQVNPVKMDGLLDSLTLHSSVSGLLLVTCTNMIMRGCVIIFVIECTHFLCSKSLKIALKVHWFLLAELEDDNDDNDGISRIQEKCTIAATLMGEWPPLIRPQSAPISPAGKRQALNRILSSKHRLLSLTYSSPTKIFVVLAFFGKQFAR
jgi:hypothetical protein